MRAFHHRNGVDLHVSQMFDRAQYAGGAGAEWLLFTQSLRLQRYLAGFLE